jgi:hypothetical protein
MLEKLENEKVQTIIALVAYELSCISFLVVLISVFCLSSKSINQANKGLLLMSALAPLTWFLMTKGHSYVHIHLNYVLWYVPFLPVAALILMDHFTTNRQLQKSL